MKLRDILSVLEADLITGDNVDSVDVEMACGADLMSDVLAHIEAEALLLTGLTNQQVVRTAEMASVVAICFVRGKRPQPETVALAASKGLPLLATKLPMFESCGLLYEKGMIGCSQKT
jgi:predicted transcriptional regulator